MANGIWLGLQQHWSTWSKGPPSTTPSSLPSAWIRKRSRWKPPCTIIFLFLRLFTAQAAYHYTVTTLQQQQHFLRRGVLSSVVGLIRNQHRQVNLQQQATIDRDNQPAQKKRQKEMPGDNPWHASSFSPLGRLIDPFFGGSPVHTLTLHPRPCKYDSRHTALPRFASSLEPSVRLRPSAPVFCNYLRKLRPAFVRETVQYFSPAA